MKKDHYISNDVTLSRSVIEKALTRLAELLGEQDKKVELVAAGGVISVLVFGSRQMTRDIDVIIAPKDKTLVAKLVDKVADELKLPKGNHAWLNDGVSFFGLQTKSDKLIFDHPNLMVFTASWYELLGMKLSGAWRRETDYDDAIHILRQIGDQDRQRSLEKSMEYRNFSPHVDDQTFIRRFDRTWRDAFD